MNPRFPLDRSVKQPARCQVPGPERSLAKGASSSLLISLVIGLAVFSGASMSSVVSAEDEVQKPAPDQVISFKASEWKGPDIAAYGDRFKAAMQLQEREARKPDWSWQDEDEGADETAMAAKSN
jgi:hypothetical protein